MPRQLRVALPLRVGLVAALLLLAACGLTASGIAVTSILRNTLIETVDQTLVEASRGWALFAARGSYRYRTGQTSTARRRTSMCAASSWTATPDGHQRQKRQNPPCRPTTTSDPCRGLSDRWITPKCRGGRCRCTDRRVDWSLSPMTFPISKQTVHALIWLQLGIGAAVLLVLGVAGYWVVNRSLRPLTEVEQTAAAIAAGQLDRRVPRT